MDRKFLQHPAARSRHANTGNVWLGWTLWRALRLDTLLAQLLPDGREAVPWATIAAVLVLPRLCEPSSELHIAEDWYRRTALEDLLALSAPLVNDDRLYRALDRLLPHKTALDSIWSGPSANSSPSSTTSSSTT